MHEHDTDLCIKGRGIGGSCRATMAATNYSHSEWRSVKGENEFSKFVVEFESAEKMVIALITLLCISNII